MTQVYLMGPTQSPGEIRVMETLFTAAQTTHWYRVVSALDFGREISPRREELAYREIQASAALLAWIDCRPSNRRRPYHRVDTSTAWVIGAAHALGKPTVLITLDTVGDRYLSLHLIRSALGFVYSIEELRRLIGSSINRWSNLCSPWQGGVC